jgi:hypothetical protein
MESQVLGFFDSLFGNGKPPTGEVTQSHRCRDAGTDREKGCRLNHPLPFILLLKMGEHLKETTRFWPIIISWPVFGFLADLSLSSSK